MDSCLGMPGTCICVHLITLLQFSLPGKVAIQQFTVGTVIAVGWPQTLIMSESLQPDRDEKEAAAVKT